MIPFKKIKMILKSSKFIQIQKNFLKLYYNKHKQFF